MSTVVDPVCAYLAEFERVASATAGHQPDWLARIRTRAIQAFESRGFPTTREEEWRFTNVAPIAEAEFRPAPAVRLLGPETLAAHALRAAAELVLVNGRYAPELSRVDALPAGVRVESLATALIDRAGELEPHLSRSGFEQQPFAALNTALWTDGAFVWLPPGAVLDRPIHIVFAAAPAGPEADNSPASTDRRPIVVHPRVLVVAGRHSQAAIVETYAGRTPDRYFTNGVTEFVLDEQAIVEHYKVQRESDASYHIATIRGQMAPASRFTSHSISFGGALVRNDVMVTMAGEGGECTLNGLYLADATRLVDNHTTIDHAKPHCSSREVYKGILAERARAVFNGKIIVRPDAQKTDAKQTNKALLLSGDAQVNTKPQLEIFANDVKCTHGAAIGQLDEDALFYLRARGVPLAEARKMLIRAFAGDVLNRMSLEPLRARMEAELLRQLARPEARR